MQAILTSGHGCVSIPGVGCTTRLPKMVNLCSWSRVRLWLPMIGSSLLLCLVAFAITPLLHSQSDGPMRATPPSETTEASPGGPRVKALRFDVNVVLVPVVVADAMNHPILGLEKQNFVLTDNNEEREIQYFSAEDAPISVGLLVDVSKSMTDKVDAEREAVSEFFKNANSEDDYFVVAFSTEPHVLTGVTQSIGTIESKLGAVVPSGSTAMLDAISEAMTRLRSAKYKRRAILIISDGGDNSSHHRYREIKSLVRDSDVQVYAIGLFDTAFFKTYEEFMGKKWLSEITDATGGRTVTVDHTSKMGAAAAAISTEMRNQYVLGYRPGNAATDGKRRQIKVRVINPLTNDAELQAYYKRGYVIPKEK
jgi:Ca-activated chloride channel homolog